VEAGACCWQCGVERDGAEKWLGLDVGRLPTGLEGLPEWFTNGAALDPCGELDGAEKWLGLDAGRLPTGLEGLPERFTNGAAPDLLRTLAPALPAELDTLGETAVGVPRNRVVARELGASAATPPRGAVVGTCAKEKAAGRLAPGVLGRSSRWRSRDPLGGPRPTASGSASPSGRR
jgi:hypothetical protein